MLAYAGPMLFKLFFLCWLWRVLCWFYVDIWF